MFSWYRARREGEGEADESETPEHPCEECAKLGIEDKPAVRKVRMNGKEVRLCEDCLRAMGFE